MPGGGSFSRRASEAPAVRKQSRYTCLRFTAVLLCGSIQISSISKGFEEVHEYYGKFEAGIM